MDVQIKLVPAWEVDPGPAYEMVREIGPGENGFGNSAWNVPFKEFPDYLKRLKNGASGVGLKPGYVPQTAFWLMVDDRPTGITKLRHYLTDALREHGGHIGYCIRPTERGKGYGNTILALTLVEARKIGIEKVMLTCNENNIPSRLMIEKNSGVLEKVKDRSCYYWIDIG